MNAKPAKPRICKCCHQPFTPYDSFRKLCSIRCAIDWTRLETQTNWAKAAKLDRKRTKERLKALKPRSYWLKAAQRSFNAFVRARDLAAGHPCISCDRPLVGKFDAGHYLSVGSHPELRFNEDGCHGQCVHDNQWKSGNQSAYRAGLIKRIGLARVEALEAPHEALKLSVGQIKAIEAEYKRKTKALLDPIGHH